MSEGFRLKKMQGKTTEWDMEADRVNITEDIKKLWGVKVIFYPRGKSPFTVKADEGWVKEDDKDEIYLDKNVLIKGHLNSDVKCENLSWDSVSETMHTQSEVEITGEKWDIKGTGMEISPSGDTVTIAKNVKMELTQ